MSQYTEQGWADRADYLQAVAAVYGIPLSEVYEIANELGPAQDFAGGLLQTIENNQLHKGDLND